MRRCQNARLAGGYGVVRTADPTFVGPHGGPYLTNAWIMG